MESVIKTCFFALVWIIGLTSTIYLVWNALYLLILAAVFGQNSPHTPVLEYLSFVAKNAIPAFCFTAIGLMGLRFWPSQRLWFLGLLALMVESALAIYILVDSEGMLAFAE